MGWKPSTSLSARTASRTFCSWICFGGRSWTGIPSTASSSLDGRGARQLVFVVVAGSVWATANADLERRLLPCCACGPGSAGSLRRARPRGPAGGRASRERFDALRDLAQTDSASFFHSDRGSPCRALSRSGELEDARIRSRMIEVLVKDRDLALASVGVHCRSTTFVPAGAGHARLRIAAEVFMRRLRGGAAALLLRRTSTPAARTFRRPRTTCRWVLDLAGIPRRAARVWPSGNSPEMTRSAPAAEA